jgi:signal transduction histidine kinase
VAVVCLAALGAATVLGAPELSGTGPQAFVVGLAAVSVQAVLLWRLPVATGATVTAVSVVAPTAAAAGAGDVTGLTSIAVLVAVFGLVLDVPWSRAVLPLALAASLVGLADLLRAVLDVGWTAQGLGAAVLQGLVTVGAAAAVGYVVRARREAALVRLGRDRALAGEQTALAQAAVARERVAMARELHDIAAHHLSGIAVMTGAIDRQIGTDPEAARTAVRQVRQQSTAMLRDLRSLVALLRDADRPTDLASDHEDLAGVPAVVEAARVAGHDVTLSLVGTSPAALATVPVGPLAQLAAYRTVQESLTNAARHAAGASCEVVVELGDDEVVVVVRNGPPPRPLAAPSAPASGTGLGMLGMRERAELTDARLDAGPDADGGWTVALTIPLDPMEDVP